jgi:hypothetical protein
MEPKLFTFWEVLVDSLLFPLLGFGAAIGACVVLRIVGVLP